MTSVTAPPKDPVVHARPLSEILDQLRYNLSSDILTTGMLVKALHERGIGALMVLFALLIMIPIPGLNTLSGIPLVLLSAQQALGRHTVWLPRQIMDKSLNRKDTLDAIAKILPLLRKLELVLRPRMIWVTTAGKARLFGAMSIVMSLFASIPIPLTHTVPGFGLLLISLGTTQRDGLAIVAGAAIGIGYIVLVVGAIAILGPHAFEIIHNMVTHAK